MKKDLKEKAIDFKGKKYVLISDRVIFFNDTYPNGMIETELLTPPDAERVVFQAIATPDSLKPERRFVGHSQATWGEGYINKTSALENAETSAVGRALALMGIGVIDGIASIDEINKTTITKPYWKEKKEKEETEANKTAELNKVDVTAEKARKVGYGQTVTKEMAEEVFEKAF